MVATWRNYTRDEKTAYRERLRRRRSQVAYRPVSEIAGRAVVTLSGLAPTLERIGQDMRKMAETFAVPGEVFQALAEANSQIMRGARTSLGYGGWSADQVFVDELLELPTVERLLGMDPASPRPQTLENMLDLPPAPIRQKTLPEEWIQP